MSVGTSSPKLGPKLGPQHGPLVVALEQAVLVGASGLIGQALLPILASRYAQVTTLTRRPLTGIAPTNIENLRVDFETEFELPACDALFCALGTTIKTAGSKEAFRRVDFDYVLRSAMAAKAAGATQMAVVSSLGASAKSKVFYSQVKGEIEDALIALKFERLVIVRPSFLQGDRAALNQVSRPGESLALVLIKPFTALIPKQYRPIAAETVARAMVDRITAPTNQTSASSNLAPDVMILESGEI
jgi:uncharacterized protein YbjT (DUF2867 family)